MLSPITSSLVFPKLKYVDTVKFGSWGGSHDKNAETSVYVLDWEWFDKKIFERQKSWWLRCGHDNDGQKEFPGVLPPLPEKYGWVTQLEYCIPRTYLNEIQRMSVQAVWEWGMYRCFDTAIREMCLNPGKEFISCAFKLIADCLYDREKNYFSRKFSKSVVESLLIYRFWVHQTGRTLPWFNAEFDMKEYYAMKYKRDEEPEDEILQVCRDIKEFEKIVNRFGIVGMDEGSSVTVEDDKAKPNLKLVKHEE